MITAALTTLMTMEQRQMVDNLHYDDIIFKTFLVTGGNNGSHGYYSYYDYYDYDDYYDFYNDGFILSSTELLVENSAAWVFTADLPAPRYGLKVANIDGRILATGMKC